MSYKKDYEFLENNLLDYLEEKLSDNQKIHFENMIDQLKNKEAWAHLSLKIRNSALNQSLESREAPDSLVEKATQIGYVKQQHEHSRLYAQSKIKSDSRCSIVLSYLNQMFQIIHVSDTLAYWQEKVAVRNTKRYLEQLIFEDHCCRIHIISLQERDSFLMEVEILEEMDENIKTSLMRKKDQRLIMSMTMKDKKIQFKNLKINDYTLYLPNKELDITMKL